MDGTTGGVLCEKMLPLTTTRLGKDPQDDCSDRYAVWDGDRLEVTEMKKC